MNNNLKMKNKNVIAGISCMERNTAVNTDWYTGLFVCEYLKN
jgi:hypothetical protein